MIEFIGTEQGCAGMIAGVNRRSNSRDGQPAQLIRVKIQGTEGKIPERGDGRLQRAGLQVLFDVCGADSAADDQDPEAPVKLVSGLDVRHGHGLDW